MIENSPIEFKVLTFSKKRLIFLKTSHVREGQDSIMRIKSEETVMEQN